MSGEKILVTGASGCIGAWVLRHLVDEGAAFIASDLSDDKTRPGLLMTEAELDGLDWLSLDVTDESAVRAAVGDNGVTHIVHLAGLQVPFCRANPALGAAVNVSGTINIFEAARHCAVRGLAYASSLAVLGPAHKYPDLPILDDAATAPDTLYGVYKVANEESARIYWQDWQVGSVGLRPGIVYGVGRDQGITSDMAKAILAAAAERPFRIRYDGLIAMQHASDVARMFIGCARAEHQGAAVCNLRNDVVDVGDFVAMLRSQVASADISVASDTPLPVPADLDDARLRAILGDVPHQPMEDAVAADLERFRGLLQRDAVDLTQLER